MSEAKENLRLFIEFAKRGQIPQMEEFLEMKVPVNGTDHLGQTALHWAASGGHDEAIEWLISQGATIDAQAKDGDTALHKAAWRGHPSACSVLIAKGINRKIKNHEGKAALDLAKTPAIKRVCTPLPELGATTNPLQRAMEEAMAAAASGIEIEDVPDEELFKTED
jgi:ankyrin repeat protein